MKEQPTLETKRLILRPITLADAPDIQRLAGEYEIAYNTLHIPHPYEDGMAEEWITRQQELYETGNQINFALVLKAAKQYAGGIGLVFFREHFRAELGYWVGKPYWGHGYGTEAAREMLRYGFEKHQLNRIYAACFSRNVASARIMEKVGMRYEGCFKEHINKWGELLDLEYRAILKDEYFRLYPEP
ncbi:MAG: GNAT family N-acetyltransferase [Candidatus Zixiibacteriota bacterium]